MDHRQIVHPHRHDNERWRDLADRQSGVLSRAQLRALGVDRWMVRNRVVSARWSLASASVISTTTGELSREQLMWVGALHSGGPALIGDLSAAELLGLQNWHRDAITVLVPRGPSIGAGVEGVRFVETRRDLTALGTSARGLPTRRLEPAVLHFAAYQESNRTAEGVLAAVVQQRLTTTDRLLAWVERLRPLRRSSRFRQAISDMEGGAQSVAEIDVRRMCRRFGLALPHRQVKRRDRSGRIRFTDCEWRLVDGRTLVLEVDGGFHMEVGHWEDDLARQRALSATNRVIVRCTSRELRDEPGRVAHDLIHIGVPRAA